MGDKKGKQIWENEKNRCVGREAKKKKNGSEEVTK